MATRGHDDADARSLSRREVIRRAAAAGAVAWTAPVIIDSLTSPAAAATCNIVITSMGTGFTKDADNQTSYTTTNFTSKTSGSTVLILATTKQGTAATPTFSASSGGPISAASSAVKQITIATTANDAWTLWAAQSTGSGGGGSLTVSVTASQGKEISLALYEITCTASTPFINVVTGGPTTSGSAQTIFTARSAATNAQILAVGIKKDYTVTAVDKGFTVSQNVGASDTGLSIATRNPATNAASETVTATLSGNRQTLGDHRYRGRPSVRVDRHAVLVPASGATAVSLDGEAIVVDEVRDRVHLLNAFGAVVWECLDGATTVGELCDDLAAELGADPSVVERDTLVLVDELFTAGALRDAHAGVDAMAAAPAPWAPAVTVRSGPDRGRIAAMHTLVVDGRVAFRSTDLELVRAQVAWELDAVAPTAPGTERIAGHVFLRDDTAVICSAAHDALLDLPERRLARSGWTRHGVSAVVDASAAALLVRDPAADPAGAPVRRVPVRALVQVGVVVDPGVATSGARRLLGLVPFAVLGGTVRARALRAVASLAEAVETCALPGFGLSELVDLLDVLAAVRAVAR